ncbi:hypothetical protein NQ315_003667 [Exocentrus adspersus]|uniref:Reverse transcriptase domain-containing protein n=1 Tax=Exocentrus adspersus TaxID=1586481 RepID=A0AAV8V9Y0_9CUCU|nr:hypothetical protein NQ315_003667 [Exocentrus adspersus]
MSDVQRHSRKRGRSPSALQGPSRESTFGRILRRLERRVEVMERELKRSRGQRLRSPATSSSASAVSQVGYPDPEQYEHGRWNLNRAATAGRGSQVYYTNYDSDVDNAEWNDEVNEEATFDEPTPVELNLVEPGPLEPDPELAGSLEVSILSPQPGSALNSVVLSILGDEVENTQKYGPPLQQDVADSSDKREKLLEKYPPPENGNILGALKLNSVIKQVITGSVLKRDTRLAALKGQIGSCLSALGMVISDLLKDAGGGGNTLHRERLSDAGRLLVDIHRSEAVSRRELVAMNLNKEWKETLADSPIHGWLFGEDLEERLRAAKALQASSRQLKMQKVALKRTVAGSKPGWAQSTSSQRTPRTSHAEPKDTNAREGQDNGEIPPVLGVRKLAGRLKYFTDKWRTLTKDKHILSCSVQQSVPREPKWSDIECFELGIAIYKLVTNGTLSKVELCEDQFLSNIFRVPKPDGTSRLILNLKRLNVFVETHHFKLEDHKVVSRMITKGCFMAKLDLKDAYFLIPNDENHRKIPHPLSINPFTDGEAAIRAALLRGQVPDGLYHGHNDEAIYLMRD